MATAVADQGRALILGHIGYSSVNDRKGGIQKPTLSAMSRLMHRSNQHLVAARRASAFRSSLPG
jgi:hypothetical protein